MKSVHTDKAPRAIGPYSQAVSVDNMIFCSGQIAIDPATDEMVKGGIKEQTVRVFKNLGEVLKASRSGLESVASVTVYLRNMSDFQDMNEIYGKTFVTDPLPARATVEVARLPKDALIEISCIAYTSL
ncbi:MAG: RidA family protein [bacterium]|nr:RidA family protein [bacterium]